MAKFEYELPLEIIKEVQKIYNNTDKIFGEMTKAGAEVVKNNIIANAPAGIKSEPQIMNKLRLSRTYKTPSDDGINTKVAFFTRGKGDYFVNSNGQREPIDLVIKVFEYGRSNAPFPKRPFVRKSFKKSQIEQVMMQTQKKASGGLLDE